MAVLIPFLRKHPRTGRGGSFDDNDHELSLKKTTLEWNKNHLEQELFQEIESGKHGRVTPYQVERLKQIITSSSGADGNLSSAQALQAIHEITKRRVGMALDKRIAEAIIDRIAAGPTYDTSFFR